MSVLPKPVPPLSSDLVSGARVLATRDAILPFLPRGGCIVEVGVGLGVFSRKLIDACEPACFTAIDTFRLHELQELWGRPAAQYFGGRSHAEWFRNEFAADIGAGGMAVWEGDSAAQMERLRDASVDVFYIDADHTYDAVAGDLAVAVRKVKPDGWIIVNDYILVDGLGAAAPYGVIYATNEFMIRHGWAMQYFALQRNMYCDVALRRADMIPQDGWADRLEAENRELRHGLNAIRSSTSWAVSAPLRLLGGLLRKRKGAALAQ